jgi:hypothetical protein
VIVQFVADPDLHVIALPSNVNDGPVYSRTG